MKHILIALMFLCALPLHANAQVAKKPRPKTQVVQCKEEGRPSEVASCLLNTRVSDELKQLLDDDRITISGHNWSLQELQRINPAYDKYGYGLAASYFMLHSVFIGYDENIDSAHQINAYTWANAAPVLELGAFQIYIGTGGELLISKRPYSSEATAFVKERLEEKLGGIRASKALSGLLHVGLLYGRRGNLFLSTDQAKTLAACYVNASFAAGRWLIPALHNSLEANSHNPQISSDFLPLWEEHIKADLKEIIETHNAKINAAKGQKKETEPESQSDNQTAQLETVLEKNLTISEISFKASIDKLVPVRDGTAIKGYKADEVVKVFLQNKRELMESLSAEEFGALRAYIEKFYPLAPKPVSVKSGFKFGVHLFSSARAEQLVSVKDLNEATTQVYALYAKLKENKQAIDLEVSSLPDGATVVLTAGSGKASSADTNSTITIFRGWYTCVVTKEGFRKITRPLNLVDERGTKLECSLSKTESGSCKMR